MKKWNLVLIAMVLSTLSLAPAARAAIEVSGDAYAGLYNKYLWRGFDLSGGKGVVQGGVDLSAKGLTLSYWTNLQLKDADGLDSGEATETDITLDYTLAVNDLVSLSLGNIFYQLDGIPDTNELYLGASLNTTLSPSFKVYYDWDEANEDGLFLSASIGHTFQVMENLGINLGALVSFNQDSDYAVGDYSGWHNYELSASADYAVTDHLSISPIVLYSAPISSAAKDAIDSQWLTGINLSLTF